MMRNSFWVIERSLQEQRIFLPNDARQDFSLFLGKTSFSRNRILSLRSGGKTELLASRTVRRSSDEKKTNTLKIGDTPVSAHETLLSGEDSKWRKICRFAKTFINKKRRNLENKKLSRKTKTKPENVFLMIIINKDGRWTKTIASFSAQNVSPPPPPAQGRNCKFVASNFYFAHPIR